MVKAKALTKFVKISPRKARYAADLIRGLSVEQAALKLFYCSLKGGILLKKTLDSAIANALDKDKDIRKENLMIDEVRVDVGPIVKRSRSKNRGGRHKVLKRTSHFTVCVRSDRT